MSAKLVVETSIWINFFRGKTIPEFESALHDNRVLTTPIVVAELLSGVKKSSEQDSLVRLLSDLEICVCSTQHWIRVGKLRSQLQQLGLSVSTPDAHVAQCAMDYNAKVLSEDRVFELIAKKLKNKIV